jgi:RimJ/RimL family protein N-acetyltransferase
VALEVPHLLLLLQTPEQLERLLHIEEGHAVIPDELRGPVQEMLAATAHTTGSYLWTTNWLIIDTRLRCVVGSFCFKGPPGASGEVELGYGLQHGRSGHGYMTEAIAAIVPWALERPGVRSVIAETEKDNLASHRVLQRCGFNQFRETDTVCWWRNPG